MLSLKRRVHLERTSLSLLYLYLILIQARFNGRKRVYWTSLLYHLLTLVAAAKMALRLDTINDDVLYLIVDHILALTNERDLSQARRRQMSERPLANFSLVNKRLRQLCLHRLFTVVYLTSTVPLILLRTAWIQRLLEAAYIRRHIKYDDRHHVAVYAIRDDH